MSSIACCCGVCHTETAERIVAIQELNPAGKRVQITSANFLDWRAQNTVFEHLAAIKTTTTNLALVRSGRADRARANECKLLRCFRNHATVRTLVHSARRTSGTRTSSGCQRRALAATLRRRSFARRKTDHTRRHATTQSSALLRRVFSIRTRRKSGCLRCRLVPELYPDQDVTANARHGLPRSGCDC